MGAVDAYDTSNNTYRIRFDRPGLGGTHSVRDEEVLSVDPPETVPLSSFIPQRVARPKPPQTTHPGLLLSSGTSNRYVFNLEYICIRACKILSSPPLFI